MKTYFASLTLLSVLALHSLSFGAKGVEGEEEFDEMHRTEIAVRDEAISADSLTAGERSTKVLERAKKIQLALYTLKCSKPTLVSPLSNPFKPAGPGGDSYSVTSKDCKLQKKKESSCESGYEARNLPENLGAGEYKVCLKTGKPGGSPANTVTGLQ